MYSWEPRLWLGQNQMGYTKGKWCALGCVYSHATCICWSFGALCWVQLLSGQTERPAVTSRRALTATVSTAWWWFRLPLCPSGNLRVSSGASQTWLLVPQTESHNLKGEYMEQGQPSPWKAQVWDAPPKHKAFSELPKNQPGCNDVS